MKSRLKNTVLASFLLARQALIIISAMAIPFIIFWFIYISDLKNDYNEDFIFAIDNYAVVMDIFALMAAFLMGISFFERHNSFCAANSVSLNNRVISAGIITLSAAAAVEISDIIPTLIFSCTGNSTADAVRASAGAERLGGVNYLADIFLVICFGSMIFSAGYFFGSLKNSVGGKATLIILAAIAFFMTAGECLDKSIPVTPTMAVMFIPYIMQKNLVVSGIFHLMLAAVLLCGAAALSRRGKEKGGELS